MESMPLRLLRRELGWKSQQLSDYKKLLCSLHSREEERLSLAVTNLTLDSSDDMNPIYDLAFSPSRNIVAAADEKGFLTLVNTKEGVPNNRKIIERYRCHQNALFSAAWSPHQTGLIATGSADLTIKLWDSLKGFQLLRQYKQHTRTVKTVKFHPSQSDIFVSGSRDGSVMVWDLRTSHETPENIIASAHNLSLKKKVGDMDVPVTDLLFKDDNTLVTCGSSDGYIKFWDLRKTYKYLKKKEPVRQIPFPLKDKSCVGFSSLCLDELNNLYAASASTEIFKFNLSNESDDPECYFTNQANMQFCVKMDVSRDGRFLIAGSMNSSAHLWDTWDTETKDPFSCLEGQSLDSTLGCAVFSPQDPLTVITGADDSSLTIWRVNNKKSHLKMSSGCHGSDSLPKVSLDSPGTKQKNDLQSIIPLYRRSQIAQVVGNWTSSSRLEGSAISTTPSSTTFNLCSLLSDLPNFVIDGRMCHLSERTHLAVSRRHTWLGNFAVNEKEKEKRSSPSSLDETPPKRLKTKANFSTPPRNTSKRYRSPRSSGSTASRKKVESPSSSSTSPSIMKYFTTPLRTSNLSTTVAEY